MSKHPKLVKRCPFCAKQYEPVLAKEPDFIEKWIKHHSGHLIQRVWPEASNEQREQLVSGVCSQKCWDDNMKDIEEEDDGEVSGVPVHHPGGHQPRAGRPNIRR